MSRQTGLLRRRGRWYLNVKVPKDVAPAIGARTIRRSLRTVDYREAARLVRVELAAVEESFAAARRRLRPERPLTERDAEHLARTWFERRHDTLTAAEATAARELTPGEALAQAAIEEDTLLDPDHPATLVSTQAAARELLVDAGLAPDPSGHAWRLLLDQLRRAYLELGRRGMDRLRGDYSGRAYDAALASDPAAPGGRGELLSVVAERWLAECGPGWSRATLVEFTAAARMLREAAGDVPVTELRRADLRQFKDLLVRSPVRGRRYRDATLPAAVEASAGDPRARRLSPATVNKLLTGVQSLMRWAVDNGYREDNPATGLRVPLGRRPDEQRRPLTTDELRVLFGSEPYRSPPPSRHAERYWLPLLALFTGARLEELAQLLVADVRQVQGVWVIAVEPGEGKALKSRAARRLIPVHSELRRAGLLKHVAALTPAGRLWPDLARGSRGGYGDTFTKWFGRRRRALGVGEPGVGLHSLRHCFAQALRDAGVEPELRNALLGHSQGHVGARYGSGFRVAALAAAVEAVRYNL